MGPYRHQLAGVGCYHLISWQPASYSVNARAVYRRLGQKFFENADRQRGHIGKMGGATSLMSRVPLLVHDKQCK